MNCTQIRECLPLFATKDLGPTEAQAVEGHLAQCSDCRGELAALQRLGDALDTLPVPRVHVDTAAIYRQTVAVQQRRLQSWRRLALVSLAAAAAVVLLSLALRLEVCVETHQLVLRWGSPPPIEVEALAAAPAPQAPTQLVSQPAIMEKMQLLSELIVALANDVDGRDARRREEAAALQAQLDLLRRQTAVQLSATQRDVNALYTAQFATSAKEGENR